MPVYMYIHTCGERGEEGSTCKKASFYGKITNLHHFNDSMILQKIAIV